MTDALRGPIKSDLAAAAATQECHFHKEQAPRFVLSLLSSPGRTPGKRKDILYEQRNEKIKREEIECVRK